MSELTPRERVLMAIDHREPDRIPIDFASFSVSTYAHPPYGYNALCQHLDITDVAEPLVLFGSHVLNVDERLQDRLGNDFRSILMGSPFPEILGPGYARLFPFGLVYKNVGGPFWYPDYQNAPLKDAKTIEDIENYQYWPDPDDPVYIAGVRERAKALHEQTEYAVIAEPLLSELPCTNYQWLRGFEQWFIDMHRNRELYEALMSKIIGYSIELAKRFYAEVGDYIDVAPVCSDDMGWQQGPFLSVKDYKEFIKPWIVKYLEAVRGLTKAKFFYHCDGSIFPLIEEFIDMGFDIISPITAKARDMEPAKLKKRYGNHITFHSGIDMQEVMSLGSVEAVKSHVAEVVRELAPGGGYIFGVMLVPDVPPAQAVAAFDTAMEVGRYPIR